MTLPLCSAFPVLVCLVAESASRMPALHSPATRKPTAPQQASPPGELARARARQRAVAPAKIVRRRIPPQAGHALEKLGHAIEYLADEYALSAGDMALLDPRDPRIQALQTLMALNRTVYRECPEVEPLSQRLLRSVIVWREAHQ